MSRVTATVQRGLPGLNELVPSSSARSGYAAHLKTEFGFCRGMGIPLESLDYGGAASRRSINLARIHLPMHITFSVTTELSTPLGDSYPVRGERSTVRFVFA